MKKIAIIFIVLTLYLVTSVPVGLFIYSMKSDMGIDVFKRTGFHGYMSCLQEQIKVASEEIPQRIRD